MKLSFLSSFPPKSCGVGQFCFDLIASLKKIDSTLEAQVYAIDDIPDGYAYDQAIVVDHFFYQDKDSYSKTAQLINQDGADICVIQHEFGLFGGENKEYLFDFVDSIKVPIVVVVHSVPVDPNYPSFNFHKDHLLRLAKKTAYFITMSQVGKDGLIALGITPDRVKVIIHGAPRLPPLAEAPALKKALGLTGFFTLIMFGLLNKQKGIEYLLDAAAEIKNKLNNLKVLVIGTPLGAKDLPYVEMIKEKISTLKLDDTVEFIQKYFFQIDLFRYIVASDIILTPYLSTNQTSSGVLAFSIAAGIPIITTPYPFAVELLKNVGVFVPYRDSRAIGKEILKLATDRNYYLAQQQKTIALGTTLSWDNKAAEYLALFKQIIS
ncbi:glycosyltransferase [Candidatus Roizmanbacteria bacterium]|nr:glycosyltransferase [Candidatus Roizmanbacteria bacterium]